MIPDLIDIGGPFEILPEGIHIATLEQIELKFVANEIRRELFDGFKQAVEALKKANCKTIFLDGSFVTSKFNPNDYDVCWDPVGVDIMNLDPTFLDFKDMRKNQKVKYGGEFFPSSWTADGSNTFLEYFQKDKFSGKRKGIIELQ